MNWVRVEDRPPALGEMVLVTIHGHDIMRLRPGETLAEALERTRREFRRVTIGMLDGEGEWTGADGWPMVVKPVAWAPLPEPWEEDWPGIEVVKECPADWDSPEDEIYDEAEEAFNEAD